MHELTTIIETLEALKSTGEPAVLATVVKTRGSTYRRPGARLLLTPDGQTTGMVSGGCLENDVLEHAEGVLATAEPTLVTYDTLSKDDIVWGLGCQGVVHVLIERVDPQHAPYLTFLADCLRRRQTGLLATVFAVQGHCRTPLGARLMLTQDASVTTNIDDPPLARAITDAAQSALAAGHSSVNTFSVAAGRVEVFLEVVQPPTSLVIFGAGPDAIPLVRLAKELGWEVTVVDQRPAYATRKRFPMADRVVLSLPASIHEHVSLHALTVAVLMTHHYLHDQELLRILLPSPVRYLGMLGPKDRTERLLQAVHSAGLEPTAEALQRLYAPVGIDLGAETPEEVALAIVVEIQSVLTERSGGSLRDREGPIHDEQPVLLT